MGPHLFSILDNGRPLQSPLLAVRRGSSNEAHELLLSEHRCECLEGDYKRFLYIPLSQLMLFSLLDSQPDLSNPPASLAKPFYPQYPLSFSFLLPIVYHLPPLGSPPTITSLPFLLACTDTKVLNLRSSQRDEMWHLSVGDWITSFRIISFQFHPFSCKFHNVTFLHG